jgi:lipid A 4'-phosphatase
MAFLPTTAPSVSVSAYRRYWLPELASLLAAALAATLAFSATRLDITAARWFYHPGLADPWPIAREPLWLAFYRSTPWITASLAAAGCALVASAFASKASGRLRLHGVFVLLTLVVGPGLIINSALKDHWGRPRPREIAEFGGKMEYAPPLLPAGAHGKSFPCGHCSVGYLYGIGWWIWRRRRPLWAALSLATGLALGTLLGFGRMAAGGHFLSDAIWSGLIALGTAHVLYYYILRIPAREDSRTPPGDLAARSPDRPKSLAAEAAVAFAALAAGVVIAASWRYKDLASVPPLARHAVPQRVEVIADTLDVDIQLLKGPGEGIECAGDVHGFGLPTDEIQAEWIFEDRPVPTLVYRVTETGWFLYVDGTARIRLPAGLRSLAVRTRHGNISVTDEEGADVREGRPEFDLRSGDGWAKGP